MNRIDPLYFCLECKEVVSGPGRLLFVEEKSNKGFCTEACIEKFYSPIVNYFNKLENKLRVTFSAPEPEIQHFAEEAHHVNETLYYPDEVWELENSYGEAIYSHIKKHKDAHNNDFYMVILCLTYNSKPSFIINNVVTKSRDIKRVYQIGKRVNTRTGLINPQLQKIIEMRDLGEVISEIIDKKRSYFLKMILKIKSRNDYGPELFSYYEKNLKQTLETPDEVYKFKDSEGDTIFCYIKGLKEKNKKESYYYYVLCLDVDPNSCDTMESVHPVLAFPSKSVDIYNEFQKGNLVAGTIKN